MLNEILLIKNLIFHINAIYCCNSLLIPYYKLLSDPNHRRYWTPSPNKLNFPHKLHTEATVRPLSTRRAFQKISHWPSPSKIGHISSFPLCLTHSIECLFNKERSPISSPSSRPQNGTFFRTRIMKSGGGSS